MPAARTPGRRARIPGRLARLARVLPAGLGLLAAACTGGHPRARGPTRSRPARTGSCGSPRAAGELAAEVPAAGVPAAAVPPACVPAVTVCAVAVRGVALAQAWAAACSTVSPTSGVTESVPVSPCGWDIVMFHANARTTPTATGPIVDTSPVRP